MHACHCAACIHAWHILGQPGTSGASKVPVAGLRLAPVSMTPTLIVPVQINWRNQAGLIFETQSLCPISALVFCIRYCTGFAGAPGYALCYGAGFYHSISGVAYSSDAFVDLIPVDTVSTLIIAAAAGAAASGPYPADTAKVYHVASSESHPCLVTSAYETMHNFWSSSPCPTKLPFAR